MRQVKGIGIILAMGALLQTLSFAANDRDTLAFEGGAEAAGPRVHFGASDDALQPPPDVPPLVPSQPEIAPANVPEDVRKKVVRAALRLRPEQVVALLSPYDPQALRSSLRLHPEWWSREDREGGKSTLLLFLPSGYEDRDILKADTRDQYIPHLGSIPGRRIETLDALLRCFICETQDVNSSVGNERGTTPLHHAARFLHPELLSRLLMVGADPTLCDNKGLTPLMLVAANPGQERILQPAPNAKTIPLTDKIHCAQLLLRHVKERGFDPKGYLTIQGRNGYTALTWAAAEGHVHLVRYLLREGANPNVGADPEEPLEPRQLSPLWGALVGFQDRTKDARLFLDNPPPLEPLIPNPHLSDAERTAAETAWKERQDALQRTRESHLRLLKEEQQKFIQILGALLNPEPLQEGEKALSPRLSAESLNRLSGVMSPLMAVVTGRFPVSVVGAMLRAGANPNYRIGDTLAYARPDFRILDKDFGVTAADDAFRLRLPDLYILLTQYELENPRFAHDVQAANIRARLAEAREQKETAGADSPVVWQAIEEINRDLHRLHQTLTRMSTEEILSKKE